MFDQKKKVFKYRHRQKIDIFFFFYQKLLEIDIDNPSISVV